MVQVDISKIINIYDSRIIKIYCWLRFKILHLRFLEEIGQYFPNSGRILDIGCGFGLFSLYYAKKYPHLQFTGIDINPKRIQIARKAANNLSLSNVNYEVADARSYEYGFDFSGAYMLDIIHHIPRSSVQPLLQQLYKKLNKNSRLIIKEVETTPVLKRWFTYTLDKIMDVNAEVNYWDKRELINIIDSQGFEVFHHSMLDILPYPHILYVCRKI